MTKLEVDGLNKFGKNPDIDMAAAEDVWEGGGTYVFPTAARIHNIVSTDAVDDSAGTGARTLTIEGLDVDYLEISETVILDGLTPVATTLSYLRVNRMKVLSAGSGGVNAGVITATAVTDATVSAQIAIGTNQTAQAIYTVPANADLFLSSFGIGVGKKTASSADGALLIRPFGEVFQQKHTIAGNSTGTSDVPHLFTPPMKIAAKSDIKIRVSVSTNDSEITGGFDGDFSRPHID